MLKRYQYWSKEGIKWTKWFKWRSDLRPTIQINKLKNEYKDESIHSGS